MYMKFLNLLPADTYMVINKTILTDNDKKNLINLYEPIIGFGAVSLYLTLYSDLDKSETASLNFSHHHLMTILKQDLNGIKKSRECLEALGLLRTYVKQGDINDAVEKVVDFVRRYRIKGMVNSYANAFFAFTHAESSAKINLALKVVFCD